MDALKPLLKEVAKLIDPTILAVAAAVLATLLVVYKKLKARKAKQASAPPPPPKAVTPSIPSDLLVDVWEKFKAELPPIFRRSLFNFQSFVVLSAAGSGKSRLIDTYTDWRKQSRQFLTSKVDDPNLQIYLGSRALVFELSPSLLQDNTSGARNAILALFRPLVKRRKPIVVVPVDVVMLQSSGPDAVRVLAESIRGKIGLLSWHEKKPIEVRVALTHLDQIEGYAEIAKLIARERLAGTIEIDTSDPGYMLEGQLLERLTELDRLLPLALKTLTSTEYTRVIHFFRDLPKYLPNLTSFIATLAAPDPLSKKPKLERIYLTTTEGGGANPFDAKLPEAARDPLLIHRIAAVAAAGVLSIYGFAGYSHERELWVRADEALQEFRNYAISAPSERSPRTTQLREEIMGFLRRREGWTGWRLFPPFFHRADRQMRAGFTGAVRERFVTPGLQHSFRSRWPYRKSLYYLSLLYSSNDNKLGQLIKSEGKLDEWARVTELDPALIRDYLDVAPASFQGAPELDGRSLLDQLPREVASTPSDDEQPWREFFQTLSGHLAARVIAPQDLIELQKSAALLLEGYQTINRFQSADPILEGLEEATKGQFDFQETYRRAYTEIEAQTQLRQTLPEADQLLKMINDSELVPIQRDMVLLDDLNQRMNLLLQPRSADTHKVFEFELRGASFEVDPLVWEEVLRNGSAREQLASFIENTTHPGEDLFFRDIDRFEPVELNRRTDGTGIFQGKVTISGRYTRQAIDLNVRPALTEASELISRLSDVTPGKSSTVALGHVFLFQADRLQGLVRSGVEIYAANYVQAIDRYYSAFRIEATSKEAAIVMLKQVVRPVSPFGEFLRAVHDNTALALDENVKLFEPLIVALQKYEPISKLMFEEAGQRPELEVYNNLLGTMLATLEGRPAEEKEGGAAKEKKEEKKPAKAEEDEEEEAGLKSSLEGAGKIAFARLRGEAGNPKTLIIQHLSSLGLDPSMHKPFTAPADEINLVGLEEIAEVVADKWANEILSELRAISIYFPFNVEAAEDVSPDQLARLFHPLTGWVHDKWRRYIEPVVLVSGTGADKQFSPIRGLRVPERMLERMMRVQRLTAALWDEEGNPKNLEVKLAAIPFPPSSDARNYLTLVYLTTASSSLVNFNQQPMIKTLPIDWTKATESKLSIEVTNIRNQARDYPPRYEVKGSVFSLLHLLAKARAGGNIRSWTFPGGENSRGAELVVSLELESDPFEIFDLGLARRSADEGVRSELGRDGRSGE